MSEALAERQTARQLDEANKIAALAAAVAVEDILARVDIERGMGLLMQRTESDKLESTRRMTSPVMLLQILNQPRPPLECIDVFAHGALLPPEPSVEAGRRQSQARMVGGRVFLKDAWARVFAEPELSRPMVQLRQDPHGHNPANELHG